MLVLLVLLVLAGNSLIARHVAMANTARYVEQHNTLRKGTLLAPTS